MEKKKLILYFIISSIVWIFGTNMLLAQFEPAPYIRMIGHLKETFFVVATGILFYFALKKAEELDTTKMDKQRLSTLINSMVDFVNFKDGEGRWVEANDFGLKLFGLEGIDYRGKKDSELAAFSANYSDALIYCEKTDEETWKNRKITRVEEVLVGQSGTERIFDTIKVPLFHPDGSRKGLVIMGRDITEKRRLINLLEESRQQYKSLFQYSPDIVYMTDLEGRFIDLNPRFKEVTGYDPEEVIGRYFQKLIPRKYKAALENYFSIVSNDNEPQHIEIEVKSKNGEKIILECTSVPMIIHGETRGIIGYGRDITKVRKTEEKLRRTEKLSVVGELAASVAHEIRNPLTSLIGFVQLLKSEDEKHQYYFSIMADELNRINHITSELLLLAKPQQLKFIQTDLHLLLANVISLLRPEAALNEIEIESSFGEKESIIECEPNQLKQLFINLIKNAIEASHPGGKVAISTDCRDDGQVAISILDDGVGISKERLERIGEPFYSSKEKGTGLGLTVSSKIVDAHHGKMEFRSELNKGTKVIINFPANCIPKGCTPILEEA
ncbi:PAS domain-containing sensor histidine kinase [Neobacillus piezotolerans]|uniref:histidine kinase n=1 Tax=Neobacillus piezotolerans TaxID=2259171 RepID=A0A3D8GQI6_9BACI|nr:PAS domain-containing sensor histidine kinase [Neobacillus piezotolerans]RDU36755.1 PAS domain-containing sensor histidine kinase [Neobacillus piezotolerans]